jgi:hypothetical protein
MRRSILCAVIIPVALALAIAPAYADQAAATALTKDVVNRLTIDVGQLATAMPAVAPKLQVLQELVTKTGCPSAATHEEVLAAKAYQSAAAAANVGKLRLDLETLLGKLTQADAATKSALPPKLIPDVQKLQALEDKLGVNAPQAVIFSMSFLVQYQSIPAQACEPIRTFVPALDMASLAAAQGIVTELQTLTK